MTRLLLAGDTHNSTEHIRYLLEVCRNSNIGSIIQLGDWGFQWPEIGQVGWLKEELKKAKVHLTFIEGNHDNFTLLKRDHFFGANHPCAMGPNLTYIPRGVTFALGGIRFAGLGGAVSIDKAQRISGRSWWPEEAITEEDMARLVRNTERFKVDVLVTHDAPDLSLWHQMGMKPYHDSEAHRKLINRALEITQPDLHYHGHMHHRHTSALGLKSGKVVRVEGLGCNGMGLDSWCILDTDDFRSRRVV